MMLFILRNVLFINIGIAIVVCLFGVFKGWTTGFQYGGGIVFAGMATLVIGIFSASHQWRRTRIYHLPQESSATPAINDLPQSTFEGIIREFHVQIHLILVGIVAIVVGSILQMIF